MERTWTPAQSAAIETRGKTLLISAAAGSGKTATLTERILRSLIDGSSDIGNMLIVTFTRAAAAELRTRISGALTDALAKDPTNSRLHAQLLKLDNARICTIDSFYLELIRSNFSRLSLSPDFRIADTAEMDVLATAVMNETIDYFYETDPSFPLFTECFSGIRGQDALVDVFLNVSSQCASLPEGIEFLKHSADRCEKEAELDFFDTAFGAVLKRNVADFADYLCCVFDAAYAHISEIPDYHKPYLASFSYLKEFAHSLQRATHNQGAYAEISSLLAAYNLPSIGRLAKGVEPTEALTLFKELRTSLSKKIKELYKKSFSKSAETIARAMHDTALHTAKLYALLSEFDVRMEQQKHMRNVMTFHDIHRYAMQLLIDENGEPTDVAKSYADSFGEIYIDEYQDVDRLQDTIFRAISRSDNRFMVGDIKQSIYGFRGAEPQVFAEYRAAFPTHDTPKASDASCETIFMSNNFRCDRPIIDFTNTICSYLFSYCQESLDYRRDDDLVFSKDTSKYAEPSPEVCVTVLLPPENIEDHETSDEDEESDEKYDKKQAEAKYIASEIQRLLQSGRLADGKRIRPGNIAVLSRNRAMNQYVAHALHALGIATSDSGKDRYFENPDVLMVLCLLNTIDNPHRDIYLAGTLRSPVFSFSLEDLVYIRKKSDKAYSLYDALQETASETSPLGERCRSFCEILEQWRDSAASLPVDRLLRMIFDSAPFICSGLVNADTGSERGGNLLLLYEYARHFESSSFKGLYSFIEFINTVMEEGRKLETPSTEVSEDRVNLLTIHQSKGLEFPVCFVCGTGIRFNRTEKKDSLLLDHPLGVAMKIADGSGFARISTPMREAILSIRAEKETEEEMRVLYVALTRARERLYVTGTGTNQESMLKKATLTASFSSRHTVLSCQSYLQWILAALSQKTNAEEACYRVSFLYGDSDFHPIEETASTASVTQPPAANEVLTQTLKEAFAFTYPYASLSRIPAKLSVSRLSPDVLDREDLSLDLIPQKARTEIPDFFKAESVSKKSAAERGTATHLFLQFCDFEYAKRRGVRAEFERLSGLGFLPPDAESLIYFDELERFFEHPLITEISKAKQVIREQRFNLLLPPDHFTRDTSFLEQIRGESLAVQGVIDLIVITQDNRLCLYDYKTDRLSREELTSPQAAAQRMNDTHALQLSYYAKAVELLFGRPCDVLSVYSTHAARLFPIRPCELTVPTIS